MRIPAGGGCSCGAVRYRVSAEPLIVHCCHCLSCQRQTGSAFALNVVVELERIALDGTPPLPVDVPRDDGSVQRIARCPACQVAVLSAYGRPDVAYLRAGTLDRPADVTPDVHIFTRSKLDWVAPPAGVPAFDAFYDVATTWRPESLMRLAALTAGDG